MRDIEESNLPVAATPGVFYQQLQFYVPASIHPRIYYLTSRKDARRYDGTDSGDNGALLLARRIPLQVPSYESFVAANPHFLLCAETTKGGRGANEDDVLSSGGGLATTT